MTGQLLLILDGVLRFYEIIIVVYVLMSWFPIGGALFDVYRVLGSVADPYLGLFRRFIPPLGNIDFSPIVAIIVLELARGILRGIL